MWFQGYLCEAEKLQYQFLFQDSEDNEVSNHPGIVTDRDMWEGRGRCKMALSAWYTLGTVCGREGAVSVSAEKYTNY